MSNNIAIGYKSWIVQNLPGRGGGRIHTWETFDRTTRGGNNAGATLFIPTSTTHSGETYSAIAAHKGIEQVSFNAHTSNYEDFSTREVIARIKNSLGSPWPDQTLLIRGNNLELGIVRTGPLLRIPRTIYEGHQPIRWNHDTLIRPNLSASGEYLGRRIVRRGRNGRVVVRYVPPDFIRGDDFQAFLRHANKDPFFLWWRPDDYPNEVELVWTTRPIRIRNTGPGGLMSVEMTLQAYEPEEA